MSTETDWQHAPPKPRVLVVDDAHEITDLLMVWLHDEYEVIAASSARTAYEVAEHLAPAAMLINAVLPDVNGFRLAEAIRQHPRLAGTPIIFMSGLRHPQNARRAIELGAVDFLVKPIGVDTIRDRLRMALRRRT